MRHLLSTVAVAALLATVPLLTQTGWAQTGQSLPQPDALHQRDIVPDSGNAKGPQSFSEQDRTFATQAAIGGKAEVELGKLAEKKGASRAVKDFGKQMVQDHGKANDTLAATAKDIKIGLPSSLDQAHRDTEARLSKLSAAQFDQQYITEMIKAHQADAAAFQKEASSGSNPALKSFASDTLPVVQQHLKMVQDMRANLSPTATSSTTGATRSGSNGMMPGTSQPGSEK
jgi:putative membrane protein